nr:MAG: RNA-dependent RNA polymerase [Porcine picobirnavirus]UAW00626.1 MAG: RNA-dependent RNA polymerase [Porcine picobirnavirus]
MPKNVENKGLKFDFNSYFDLPNPGLVSYFDMVRKGNDEEYRTPFFKGKAISEVLDGWRQTLETISDKWPTLWEFENDLASKVGPMSIMKPLSERMDDIDHYYEDILLPQNPISDRAIKAVLAEWSAVRGLHARSYNDTVANMKLSTNSGSPYFTKRRVVQEKHPWSQVAHASQGFTTMYDDQKWMATAILGWRGQEGGPNDDDVKQRVVWMFPYYVNIAELQIYQPLIEGAQRHELVPAWVSMESVDAAITRLFDTKAPNDLIVCTDFTKFDQHFNPVCQDAARSILSDIIARPSKSQMWLDSVFPIKYDIPLAYDYQQIRTGRHGMASGSGGTNADETLVHRALQYEAAQAVGQRLNPNSQCLGDDGILSYPGITVEDVTRSYTAHGLEMNLSKQYASAQDCTYLRRWHHNKYRVNGVCVGVYSTCRALGRLMEQERYYDPESWGKEQVALRQLSILENVKWHPLKEQFVAYCMKGDKYRLGLDIPGFLDNIQAIARESIDNMPDFLGYTKSLQNSDPAQGIADWWIVKYLKSLA